jgi:LmbE family N-acetylglucosaminyl deacetylase
LEPMNQWNLQPLESVKSGTKILVITAHPDDVDFGAGGTIAHLVEQGAKVSYLITTDGNQGGEDASISRAEMAQIRRREQIAAGAVLGVNDITFLGELDGSVFSTLDLRKKFVRHIRIAQPEILLTQSPERNWERIFASHPDHLAVGETAVQAVYPDARNQFAFPDLLAEGLSPWHVKQIWLLGHPNPNSYQIINDQIEKKFAALAAHQSQTAHIENLREMVSGWMQTVAERANLPKGDLAEAFFVANS